MNTKYTAILLAAGQSQRMGEMNKLLLPFDGEPLLLRAIRRIQPFSLQKIIVVYSDSETKDVCLNHDSSIAGSCQWLFNDFPERGQGHSIVLGVRESLDSHGVLFFLGDHPFILPEIIERILQETALLSQKVIRPYNDRGAGHPVFFPKEYFKELLTLEGDCGPWEIMQKKGVCHSVIFKDSWFNFDVDTQEDYQTALAEMERRARAYKNI